MGPFTFFIGLNNSQWLHKLEMVKLRSELRFESTQSQCQCYCGYESVCVCVCVCVVEIDMSFLQSFLTF